MTKFEEEVNKYNIFERTVYLEGGPKKILIDHFKNWHSDEEFQDMKAIGGSFALANRNLIDENKKLVKEISDLKSQLQQQALPVVPECVGSWIEHCKGMGYSLTASLTSKLSSTLHEELSTKILKWLGNEGNDETFALAFITRKYTVENTQLFYLREKNTGYYLRKTGNSEYEITPHYSNDYDEKYMHYKFTQQEIDSMQTGSYELVPEEEGK